jgi:phage portal protein BeeE
VKKKGLWYRLRGGGSAIQVSPGDELFERIRDGAPDTPLATRELATHWAVVAVTGQIARGLAGVELDDVMRTSEGYVPARPNKDSVSDLLRPHVRRMAKDILRFGEAVLVIVTPEDGRPRELVPIPPDEVSREENGDYKHGDKTYKPEKVLHIADEVPAVAPIESLRPLLEEDIAAQTWRKAAWRTAPRGIISRPDTAPEWSEAAMERFSLSFLTKMKSAAFGLLRGTGDGIPVLEEGMTWHDLELPDAGRAQFIEARKHTADAVASLYGINGSLLATGDDRQLGPARRQMLNGPVKDLALLIGQCASDQLAIRMYGSQAVNNRIMPRFDIVGALRGEEEEPGIVKSAVGVPWRTVNEQRKLEGRDPKDGGDELAKPQARAVVTEA